MTRRVTWMNLGAIALIVTLGGCCGFDPCGIDLNPCNIDLSPCDTGCDAPEPAPCDPSPCATNDTPRPNGLPAEAKAGEAWCRVQVPPQYEEYEERVMVTPASTDRQWIEPVYEDREKRVCVRPASVKRINIPAEFETQTEQVMTCAARTVWQKIPCEPDGLGNGEKQGDCWKLVEIPAQYRTVEKRVCVKQASCTTEQIPAEFNTVTEKVMVTPGEW